LVSWIASELVGELVNETAPVTTGMEAPLRELHAGS
jgi:hypothetical protein